MKEEACALVEEVGSEERPACHELLPHGVLRDPVVPADGWFDLSGGCHQIQIERKPYDIEYVISVIACKYERKDCQNL